jgi:hypothetical protein
MTFH